MSRLSLALLIIILFVGVAQAAGPDVASPDAVAQESGGFWIGWSKAINLSQSPKAQPQATWPTMSVDASGQHIHVAWSDDRQGEIQDVYYASSSDGGGSWTTAMPVTTTTMNSLRPSVVADGPGAFLAWAEESGISHTTYQSTSDAGELLVVPNEQRVLASVSRLALGPNGDLHLVLQGGLFAATDILYSHRAAGATEWPTATVVFNHTAAGSNNPDIAVSPDGQVVHLVWQENVSGSESAIHYLRGQRSGDSIVWGTPRSISSGIAHSVRPAITVPSGPAADTTVHVTWAEQGVGSPPPQYVRYARSEDGGSNWSAPVRIHGQPFVTNDVAPTDVQPSLAIAPSGVICVAWHGYRPSAAIPAEEIYLSCSGDGGNSWTSPVDVSRSPGVVSIRPVLGVGDDGILRAVWQESKTGDIKSGFQIYYAQSLPYLALLPLIRK